MPFKTKLLNLHAILQEIVLIVLLIMLALLSNELQKDPSKKKDQGELVALLTLLFTIVSLLFIPIDMFQNYKNYRKGYRK